MAQLPVPQMQSTGKKTSLVDRVSRAWGAITGTDGAWMGPGEPMEPVAPEGTGGRAFDYDFGFNQQTRKRAGTSVTFDQLRALADGYDLLRVVLEHAGKRTNMMERLESLRVSAAPGAGQIQPLTQPARWRFAAATLRARALRGSRSRRANYQSLIDHSMIVQNH